MAFNSVQTSVTELAGFTPPLVLITGTYVCDAGTTGGVISPGYNNAAGTLAAATTGPGAGGAGCGQIVGSGVGGVGGVVTVIPTLSDATAPGGATAFNATRSRDEFTLVCTANSTGVYSMLCQNNGSQP